MTKLLILWPALVVWITSFRCTESWQWGMKDEEEQQLAVSGAARQIIQRHNLDVFRGSDHDGNSDKSSIFKACHNYIVCETFPVVGMKNVAFSAGSVYLSAATPKITAALGQIDRLHAGKPGHLPSCLVTINDNSYDFVAGPKIMSSTSVHGKCQGQWKNTSAVFLFPWEAHNAYHSMNDNLFSVLTHVYMNSLLFPSKRDELIPHTLYHFNRISGGKSSTTMFRLLAYIFGAQHYQPARNILRGNEAQCLREVTWASTFKSFYRDTFFQLRSELYEFLRNILLRRHAKLREISKSRSNNPNYKKKVVIVTRGGTSGANAAARRLSSDTERRMMSAFQKQGAEVTICCDFAHINTVEKLVEVFWDVDICVGVHGAGLSNCIFGSPGMVLVEFQTHHAFGFDSFMKIAHLAKGHYLMYDVRNAPVQSAGGDANAGANLQDTLLANLAQTALALHKFSIDHLHVVLAQLHPANMSQPVPGKLHRHETDYQPDQGKIYTYRPPRTGAQLLENLSQGELIVDFKAKDIFLDKTIRAPNDVVVTNYAEIFASNYIPESAYFALRPMSEHRAMQHVQQSLENLDRTAGQSAVRSNGPKRGANFDHIDRGYLYKAPMNHKELWIVLNPAIASTFPKTTVLGPLMDNAYDTCIKLPYFKFRLMTMAWIEHRGECDRNLIQRKRSGLNDNALQGRLLE